MFWQFRSDIISQHPPISMSIDQWCSFLDQVSILHSLNTTKLHVNIANECEINLFGHQHFFPKFRFSAIHSIDCLAIVQATGRVYRHNSLSHLLFIRQNHPSKDVTRLFRRRRNAECVNITTHLLIQAAFLERLERWWSPCGLLNRVRHIRFRF